MKQFIILLVFSFLAALPGFARADGAASPAGNLNGKLKLIKQPIHMDWGANPLLAVTFNHSTHTSVKCRTCHHKATEQGHRFVNCTVKECHSIPGARERVPLSMFMAYHARDTDRSCYGCHRAEAPAHPQFKGCRPCHMSPMAREEQVAAMSKKPADMD